MVLGPELGLARAVGAIIFSLVIGVSMHFIFRSDDQAKQQVQAVLPEPEVKRPLWQNALFFGTMAGILVFANWGRPQVSGTLKRSIDQYLYLFRLLQAIITGWTHGPALQ
jgi:hypothetical protein